MWLRESQVRMLVIEANGTKASEPDDTKGLNSLNKTAAREDQRI